MFRPSTPVIAVMIFIAALQVSCGPIGPVIEVRKADGINTLFLHEQVIHRTTRGVSSPEAFVAQADDVVAASWREDVNGEEKSFYAVRDDGEWQPAREMRPVLDLRTGAFDPLKEPDTTSHEFSGPTFSAKRNLYLVQFKTEPHPAYIDVLKERGIEVHHVIHHQAVLARSNGAMAEDLKDLAFVRWVGPLGTEKKIAPSLYRRLTDQIDGDMVAVSVVLLSPKEREQVLHDLAATYGRSSILTVSESFIELNINSKLISRLASDPRIQWVEFASGSPEEDMDTVREQGGANFLEGILGLTASYTGVGIRGHVLEGINLKHPDFAANDFRSAPIAVDDPRSSPHGHATFGIIFGSGAGNPSARGLLPNGQGLYTHYDAVHGGNPFSQEKGTRYELVKRLVDEYRVMFQTASWGHSVTEDYNSRSLELDNIIFDHDIPITQSSSNKGDRDNRPQAWAKNVITVGAVYHFDTADFSDDRWRSPESTEAASIGPASDGRIKPDLVGNYDSTFTTAIEGYRHFTGTSAATPIVAGYMGLALEMWTNGIFGNELKAPLNDRFGNRPHFSTVKALLINTAHQYPFEGEKHDLTRVHQGWGFPSVKNLYNAHAKIDVVNEDIVLKRRERYVAEYQIGEKQPEFRVTMVYPDPVGSIVNQKVRTNNLNLKVTSPDGTVYWGNWGLLQGNVSLRDGVPNDVDTVENVFIKDPASGRWTVEVIADEVLKDGHVETRGDDVDFALVVNGMSSRESAKIER